MTAPFDVAESIDELPEPVRGLLIRVVDALVAGRLTEEHLIGFRRAVDMTDDKVGVLAALLIEVGA